MRRKEALSVNWISARDEECLAEAYLLACGLHESFLKWVKSVRHLRKEEGGKMLQGQRELSRMKEWKEDGS